MQNWHAEMSKCTVSCLNSISNPWLNTDHISVVMTTYQLSNHVLSVNLKDPYL